MRTSQFRVGIPGCCSGDPRNFCENCKAHGAPRALALDPLDDATLLRMVIRQTCGRLESGCRPPEPVRRMTAEWNEHFRPCLQPDPAPSLADALRAAHGLGPVVVTTTRENNGVLDPPDLATAIRQQGRSA